MTIKEAEEKTGLSRSNIRFYEKEGLIAPLRTKGNGYRDYSDCDIEEIKKIAYLRTLGISIEEIRKIISGEVSLGEILRKQRDILENQIAENSRAKILCEKMLAAEAVDYEDLRVEQYMAQPREYWEDYQPVFKLDSVGFLYAWGSFLTWGILTLLCLLTAVWSYDKLPAKIPIQWNGETVSSLADKHFIFAYPVICIVIRYLLRPIIYGELQMTYFLRGLLTEYLTNYLCFIAFSAEVFTVLYLYGLAKNVTAVLFADTLVLLGLLAVGIWKMNRKKADLKEKVPIALKNK